VAITANELRRAAARAKEAAALAQDDLNVADGKMGDGDTGVMLRRLFEAVPAAIPDQETDIGAVFQACSEACAGGTGSSLGTLVTVAMMTLAKATKGRSKIGWNELSPLLASVRDQMMARGGAMLGDKTVVDMIDARNYRRGQHAVRRAPRRTRHSRAGGARSAQPWRGSAGGRHARSRGLP
jgi:phosphoenolpyruvate---glycerone phosphotransferase subunit DhaL